MFCISVLSPIVLVIRTFIEIVKQIVRTVCGWVSSTITVVKEVLEKVCKWLPWPLSTLCEWVKKTIEVIETVWEWVCHDVLETIIEWVEIVLVYVIYVLKWICWVIDWITRLPEYLLCKAGVEPQKYLGVCVKILTDNAGTPAVPVADVQNMMRDAAAIFSRCNIKMVVCDIELITKPEYLDSTTCEPSGMFKGFFSWFSTHACGCCTNVTVYIVRDIVGASGCAYPGTDWVTVAANGDGTVVVQEIGHLCDLWGHTSDPNNVMTDQGGGTHDQITHNQCCMIRTSRFVKFALPCGLFRSGHSALVKERLELSVGDPFKREDRGKKEEKSKAPSGGGSSHSH